MKIYSKEYHADADKFLAKQTLKIQKAIRNVIASLPYVSDIVPLKSARGMYRARKGKVRVLFWREEKIDKDKRIDGIIHIVDIEYRGDAYKSR